MANLPRVSGSALQQLTESELFGNFCKIKKSLSFFKILFFVPLQPCKSHFTCDFMIWLTSVLSAYLIPNREIMWQRRGAGQRRVPLWRGLADRGESLCRMQRGVSVEAWQINPVCEPLSLCFNSYLHVDRYTVKGLNYMVCKRAGWSGDIPICEGEHQSILTHYVKLTRGLCGCCALRVGGVAFLILSNCCLNVTHDDVTSFDPF